MKADRSLIDALHQTARRVSEAESDLDPIIDAARDARFVLVGEASHGTHEFYSMRADLTRRLIEEQGFTAVVVEADWPDAYRINRYVRGFEDDTDALESLGGFKRFPQWMWRNTVVLDFVRWLRDLNDRRSAAPKVGFYGMDLYSLFGSIAAVLKYLERVDPDAALRARSRYECFEHFGGDPQAYGYSATFDLGRSCADNVVQQLMDLRQRAADYARRDGRIAEDEYFYAEQNARLIKNAEAYYRAMFGSRQSSWNVRDRHMVQTLEALTEYLDRHVGKSRVVVWAHNSHLGDARATEMGQGGEVNVGQLVRERWGREALLVGFSTYTGTVTAASNWDGRAETKTVRPGLSGSFEALFHDVGMDGFLFRTSDIQGEAGRILAQPRLQRAIGVIYRPQTERLSHYFHTRLNEQFDFMIHLDKTRAVEPLEQEVPSSIVADEETYPTGL